MQINGWGRFPRIQTEGFSPRSQSELADILGGGFVGISRGRGRSYGDSSLAGRTISTDYLDHILDFDAATGLLACEAGISLDTLISIFVPRGWFLPVVPGTRQVSVGGAIASDIHGKNHHVSGCFSQYVRSMQIMLADGSVVSCSETERGDLFRAVCGGMGLIGIIVSATLQMLPVTSSRVRQTVLKAGDLAELLDLFDENRDTTYSAAWIDCIGRHPMGRSLLMIGEHDEQASLQSGHNRSVALPVPLPGFVLNRLTGRLFNELYFGRVRESVTGSTVSLDPFFFPLDGVRNWNLAYGSKGFLQYQFVIPVSAGVEGVATLLSHVVDSHYPCHLAVLKTFGPQNRNYLSFPMEGYTLALDFKYHTGLFAFLDELDSLVVGYGGRIYLTKDARMSRETFHACYPQWQEFSDIRQQYGANGIFQSLQSERLGL